MNKLKQILTSKDFRLISSIIVVILMGYFLINSYYKKEAEPVVADSKEAYTVTVVNVNENASSKATIAIKEGENYVDTNTSTTSVPYNTKVKIQFKDGMKNYEEIFLWANYDNGLLAPIKDTDDNTLNYTKEYLIQTIKTDLTIYIGVKQDSDKVVYYYNSSVTAHRSLIYFDVVKIGSASTYKGITPKSDGFDFIGWSEELDSIISNVETYPIFDSSVWTVFRDYYPMFFKGLGITLLLSIISVFCALFLGIVLCLMRLSNIKIVKFIAATYVEVIRGVPLLLQLLVIYVVLGPTKIHIGSFFTTEVISCLLALFINSGAYSSEIFRSGIQAVDRGQMEAGRALGMSKWTVLIKIVIPQGIKNSLPSIGNELVSMVKETSLAVSVDASIGELMSVRKQITAATYINLPPYIIVAIIYFCVTFTLSKLIGKLEKRLEGHEH